MALANLLRDDPPQPYVSAQDYFDAFLTCVRRQRFLGHPYVGEYLDETTDPSAPARQNLAPVLPGRRELPRTTPHHPLGP